MKKSVFIMILAIVTIIGFAQAETSNKLLFRPKAWIPLPIPLPRPPATGNTGTVNTGAANTGCPNPQNGCLRCTPVNGQPGITCTGANERGACYDRFVTCPATCTCTPLCDNNCRP